MYTLNAEQTLADIAIHNFRAAGVFRKYGLDFCCGGKKPIKQVCEEHGLHFNSIIEEITQMSDRTGGLQIRFDRWPADKLIFFIVEHHHAYVKESIPLIKAYSDKVAMRHGENMPALVTIRDLFYALADDLQNHMENEEQHAFPLIQKIMSHEAVPPADIESAIHHLEDEHSAAGHLLKQLSTLTNNYTAPEWACNTFNVLFSELDAFEKDLHHHIHLENNLLFAQVQSVLKGNHLQNN